MSGFESPRPFSLQRVAIVSTVYQNHTIYQLAASSGIPFGFLIFICQLCYGFQVTVSSLGLSSPTDVFQRTDTKIVIIFQTTKSFNDLLKNVDG